MLRDMRQGAVRWKLPQILENRGLKQIQLAERTGLHKQTISRLCGDIKQIDLETLDKLCDALDIEPGDLLQRTHGKGGD